MQAETRGRKCEQNRSRLIIPPATEEPVIEPEMPSLGSTLQSHRLAADHLQGVDTREIRIHPTATNIFTVVWLLVKQDSRRSITVCFVGNVRPLPAFTKYAGSRPDRIGLARVSQGDWTPKRRGLNPVA